MLVAYVSGPYRDRTEYGVKCNVDRAEKVALELWNMGFAVICPHKNTFLFGGAGPNQDDDIWLEGDLEFVRRSDIVVTIPGWVESEGSRAEVQEARKNEIPVLHWPSSKLSIYQYIERAQQSIKDRDRLHEPGVLRGIHFG